jgi:hypothetical protein
MVKLKADAPAVETVALVAVEPIRLDGSDVAPGDEFSASASVAAVLTESGAARLAG